MSECEEVFEETIAVSASSFGTITTHGLGDVRVFSVMESELDQFEAAVADANTASAFTFGFGGAGVSGVFGLWLYDKTSPTLGLTVYWVVSLCMILATLWFAVTWAMRSKTKNKILERIKKRSASQTYALTPRS